MVLKEYIHIPSSDLADQMSLSLLRLLFCLLGHPPLKHRLVFPFPLQAFQLGPTEASYYWVYWVPTQYVDAIKDTVLGKWQYF